MSRCLIVDDHADGRDGYQEYLETNGIVVAATATAEDALSLVKRHSFDLMIVDLQLSGMNGWTISGPYGATRRCTMADHRAIGVFPKTAREPKPLAATCSR
jgi:CheY-like chemotaxis protein